MNIYRVSGTMTMNVSLHVEAADLEQAKLGLMTLGQRLALTRLEDETEVGDFAWTDVTVEQTSHE